MTLLSTQSEQVACELELGGFKTEADEIRKYSSVAEDHERPTNERIEALTQLAMRCHVKWLGDLYLAQLSRNKWWSDLDSLARTALKMKKEM